MLGTLALAAWGDPLLAGKDMLNSSGCSLGDLCSHFSIERAFQTAPTGFIVRGSWESSGYTQVVPARQTGFSNLCLNCLDSAWNPHLPLQRPAKIKCGDKKVKRLKLCNQQRRVTVRGQFPAGLVGPAEELSLDFLLLLLKYEPLLPPFLCFEPNPACELGDKSFTSSWYRLSLINMFSEGVFAV